MNDECRQQQAAQAAVNESLLLLTNLCFYFKTNLCAFGSGALGSD
jgi:hypothetical protein